MECIMYCVQNVSDIQKSVGIWKFVSYFFGNECEYGCTYYLVEERGIFFVLSVVATIEQR